jgi:hypothetical protein
MGEGAAAELRFAIVPAAASSNGEMKFDAAGMIDLP